ncbi:hypothetical protein AV530_012689 [Patagioenas fasciata monilis]|uniref:Uncharacterized protein n=1 Tax=Patagioenas fasciata monilis TaxID=372326 RepID=A0A1V4JD65_PATFA|nr:hypothetical protein AV530_012689 [Patagioenas fasciata monilis]
MPKGGCDPMGSLRWNKFAGRTCDPMKDPGRSSLFLKDCTQWRTHVGALPEELRPMRKTHVGKVRGGLSPIGRDPTLEQRKKWQRQHVVN